MTQSELQLKANDLRDSITQSILKFAEETGLTPNINIATYSANTFSLGSQFTGVRVTVNVDL